MNHSLNLYVVSNILINIFMLISEIYNKNITFVSQDKTVREVVEMMGDTDHNGFVVINNKQNVVGTITIQDIASSIIPEKFKNEINIAKSMYKAGFFSELCKEIGDKKIKNYMRKDFSTVSLDDNILTIIANFLTTDTYLVPVVADDKLIGLVARKEIKKALAKGLGIQ